MKTTMPGGPKRCWCLSVGAPAGGGGGLADIGWKHNLCRARDLRDLEQFY